MTEVLYKANLENQDLKNFPFICMSLRTPWNKIQSWYTIENPQPEYTVDTYLDEFERIFKYIKERSPETNSELSLRVFLVPVIPIDNIVSKVVSIASQKLKSRIAAIHVSAMYECYTEIKDLSGAKYNAELAIQLEPEPEDVQDANNLGYLFMSLGVLDKAKLLFEIAQKRLTSTPEGLPLFPPSDISDFWGGTDALVYYNLGIIWAMQNNFEKAIDFMQISIEMSQKREDQGCACLFVPEKNNNTLEFHEVLQPNLLNTAKSSIETIRAYISTNKQFLS